MNQTQNKLQLATVISYSKSIMFMFESMGTMLNKMQSDLESKKKHEIKIISWKRMQQHYANRSSSTIQTTFRPTFEVLASLEPPFAPCLGQSITMATITAIAIIHIYRDYIIHHWFINLYQSFIIYHFIILSFYRFIILYINYASINQIILDNNNSDNNHSYVFFVSVRFCVYETLKRAQTQGNCLRSSTKPEFDSVQKSTAYTVSPSSFGRFNFLNFLFECLVIDVMIDCVRDMSLSLHRPIFAFFLFVFVFCFFS